LVAANDAKADFGVRPAYPVPAESSQHTEVKCNWRGPANAGGAR